jgi:hypothetical protein
VDAAALAVPEGQLMIAAGAARKSAEQATSAALARLAECGDLAMRTLAPWGRGPVASCSGSCRLDRYGIRRRTSWPSLAKWMKKHGGC